VRVAIGKEVEAVVESTTATGKTVLINVSAQILSAPPEKVEVLFDSRKIDLADNYADVLSPTDENVPEYLILAGGRGFQVLVSIPSFSRHIITIRGPVAVRALRPRCS
jgi:hypothetical protein